MRPAVASRAAVAAAVMAAAAAAAPGMAAAAVTAARASPVRARLQEPVAEYEAALRAGRYEQVIDALAPAARQGRLDAASARLLLRAWLATGHYDEVIEAAGALGPRLGEAALGVQLGRALAARGRLQEAERALRAAAAAEEVDVRLRARLELGLLELRTGRRAQGRRRLEWFIDLYNDTPELDARALAAVGVACVHLGGRDPQLLHDAVRAFDEAIAADPADPEPRLRLGELFLDKYDSGQAEQLLADVLRANPRDAEALLADARRLEFDGSPGALERARAALAVNPNLVPARVMLARLLLQAEQTQQARGEIDRALRVNPSSRAAWATAAALSFVRGDRDGFERAMQRALAIDPTYGEGFRIVAEVAVQHRLYAEAVQLAERAVRLDPSAWAAYGTLGINQLRLGRIDEGRRNLEIAFRGDPFNVWYKNTLDLLDTFGEYRTVSSEHFDLFLESQRADLLALYMAPLAEEALAKLSERYGTGPPGRVRVEVYRRHADFSVRTVGLAGVGALGVTFGPVVAVDAPAAAGMGEFNWGSTLWHEIAHVITMTATEHRVPRWLTEGLSVFEERRARPGWGEEVDPGFLLAWLQGRLSPLARINDGFVRPRYPQQVAHAYLHASLLCELIDEEFGFDALRALLAAYRRGEDTEEALRAALGIGSDELDARFGAFLERHYGRQIDALRPALGRVAGQPEDRRAQPSTDANAGAPPADERRLEAALERDPDDYLALLELGVLRYRQRRDEEALELLVRARDLFPEHADADSAYPYLARLYEQRGELAAAAEALEGMLAHNESAYEPRLRLAELYARLQKPQAAARTLEAAIWINPYEPELHTRLADLLESTQQYAEAVRERRAVVALGPADRAEALLRLARAQMLAGDLAGARRSVLGALEQAPGYAPAQELLLRLRAAREQAGGGGP